MEATILGRREWKVLMPVGVIGRPVGLAEHAHLPVTEVRHDGADRSIDGEVLPIDAQT